MVEDRLPAITRAIATGLVGVDLGKGVLAFILALVVLCRAAYCNPVRPPISTFVS